MECILSIFMICQAALIAYWFYLVVKEIKIKIQAKFKINSSISHPHAVPNLYDFKMNSCDLIITNRIGCYMPCELNVITSWHALLRFDVIDVLSNLIWALYTWVSYFIWGWITKVIGFEWITFFLFFSTFLKLKTFGPHWLSLYGQKQLKDSSKS